MEELVAGSLRSMQAGLAPLKQQAPAAADSEHGSVVQSVKSDLDTAAEAVKKEVSKIGLVWGGELKPTAGEAAPLLRELSERVLHLFALYNGIRLAGGAGSTLAHDLAQRASAVITAVRALLETVVVAGEAGRLHMLVGRVFDACDAAKTAARDNCTAIGRTLTAVLRSCADSLREARELTDRPRCAEAEEQPSAAADVDFEADECTPQELEVAEHSVALVTAATSLLRLSCRALLHDTGGPALTQSRESYENIVFLAKPVSALVNDLVASLYPPQDAADLAELSAALHTSCECIVSDFPMDTAPTDVEPALRTAQLQLDEAHAALAGALNEHV